MKKFAVLLLIFLVLAGSAGCGAQSAAPDGGTASTPTRILPPDATTTATPRG